MNYELLAIPYPLLINNKTKVLLLKSIFEEFKQLFTILTNQKK
jgi:hypothetical protein